MVEPEESAYRISTTALALVIGVWGGAANKLFANSSRFALLAASVMDDFRNEIPHGFLNHGAAFQL
jgi:hypothetical protein